MKIFALASCLSLFLAGSVSAQETPRYTFQVGAGFTQPVGNTGRQLDQGWNIGAGGGLNFGPYFSALIDLNYNSFGINSVTLNSIGVPGGDMHVFSATLDPMVHLTPHNSHVDIYVSGGGGIFHSFQEFTAPTVDTVLGYNPFFGFYPVFVPANQVIASSSVNKPGFDVGAGIAVGTRWRGKIFAEARYNHIFLNNSHADYLPVSFGFRW